jgi:hypothetical protein
MAGLNNLLSDTQQTTTTLPSWYDAAQQQVVGQGVQAYNQAPQMGQTVAQGAINQLQPGQANPFTQAQGTLQQISSGAANPWITDASGQVTPNTNTAMGGLFAAQNQQLKQLMPNVTAPVQGANIASGNFGSLRGQTAYDKAIGDATAQMNAQQLQAALTNQQTGYNAAAQLGNVTNQGINAAMNVGQAQQNAPFTNVGNLASLLGTINAPSTVSSQKQLAPLGQLTTLGNAAMGGLNSLTSLSKTPVGKSILNAVGLGKAFGIETSPTGTPAVTYGGDTATQQAIAGGATAMDDEGNPMPGWTKNADGSYSYSSSNIPDTSGNSGGGGDTGTEQDLYAAEQAAQAAAAQRAAEQAAADAAANSGGGTDSIPSDE